jgi:hypothetical protein
MATAKRFSGGIFGPATVDKATAKPTKTGVISTPTKVLSKPIAPNPTAKPDTTKKIQGKFSFTSPTGS